MRGPIGGLLAGLVLTSAVCSSGLAHTTASAMAATPAPSRATFTHLIRDSSSPMPPICVAQWDFAPLR